MQDMNMMESEMPEEGMGTPIDQIISRVDSYITNPKAVTPETLQELKMELMDLKTILDGEETPSGEEQSPGGLAAMIGGKQ